MTERDENQVFKPWWFFGALLAPAVATLLVAPLIMRDDQGYFLTLGGTVLPIACLVLGTWCGIHFTLAQRSLSQGLKIVLGVVSVVGCIGVSYGLAFGGCIAIMVLME